MDRSLTAPPVAEQKSQHVRGTATALALSPGEKTERYRATLAICNKGRTVT